MARLVDELFRTRRGNAVVSWGLIGFVVIAAATSLLRGDRLWAAFAVVVAALAILPPVAFGKYTVMLPWEVTALTALPLLGRSISTLPLANQVTTYFSVAAIALVVAVELQLFTTVRMNDAFAVIFVVVTTLASAGVWAVARWTSDAVLGTGYLSALGTTEHAVERALMLEFVASTVAGVLAGIVFAYYVRRHLSPSARVPTEVAE